MVELYYIYTNAGVLVTIVTLKALFYIVLGGTTIKGLIRFASSSGTRKAPRGPETPSRRVLGLFMP